MSTHGEADRKTRIAGLRAAIDRRLLVALAMIAVAALGAYVAFETGANELRGAQFEREFVQNYLLSLTEHQRLADFQDTNEELRRRIRAAQGKGTAYLNAAREPGQPEPNAEILSLRAQEEFAAARALQPLVRATRVTFGNEVGGDERNLERRLARYLSRQGVDVDASGRNLWAVVTAKIHHVHWTVRGLSLSVLLFVVSLVTFTFADLSRRMRLARHLYVIGTIVAIVGVAVVLYVDPQLWSWLLLPLFVPLLVFGVVAWRVMRRRHVSVGTATHMETTPIEPRAPALESVHGHHAAGEPARRIIRMIAITVFFSTVAGFLYSRATTEAGEMAHEALQKSAEMQLRSAQRVARVLDRLEDLAEFEEGRARYIAARQRAAYLSGRDDPTAYYLAATEASAQERAMAYEELTPRPTRRRADTLLLRANPDLGMDADAAFPQRFVRQTVAKADHDSPRESLALWDTYNRRSLASSEHAAAYLATLTMFAVALCLFGQAFNTTRGLATQALLLAGKGLVMLGIGCTVLTFALAFDPRLARLAKLPSDPAPGAECAIDVHAVDHLTAEETQAAHEYARAHAMLGDANYQAAVRALSCVVALRPDSVLAKLDYASAVERAGISQSSEGFARTPSGDTVATMQKDMKTALDDLRQLSGGEDDGRAPAQLLGNLGRYTVLLALDKGDVKGLEQGVDYLRRAHKRASRADPVDRARILFNLSLALRATNNDAEAQTNFRQAVGLIARQNKRLAARAISDLEVLESHCENIATKDQCTGIRAGLMSAKEELVARTWNAGESDVHNGQASIGRAAIEVYPDIVRWRGTIEGAGPHDQATIVWYEFDDKWKAWRALPGVSDSLTRRELRQPTAEVVRSYLKESGYERCLSDPPNRPAHAANRRYRAEVYLNGKRVSTSEREVPPGEFQAFRNTDLDIAFCHPAGWTPAKMPAEMHGEERLVRGLQTARKGGSPVVFMLTIYAPLGHASEAERTRTIEQARKVLVEMELLDERSGPLVRHDASTRACDRAIAKASAAYVTWTSNEGARHVGVALTRAAPAEQICAVLDSMTNRYSRDAESPVE